MAKRTPQPEFTRGRESHPVVLADGTKAQLAHQLKRGIAQSYWYYLQWPCGGWREFDMRWLYPEDQEDQVEAEMDEVLLSPDPAVRATALAVVAERLTHFPFASVKKISFVTERI